MAPKPAISSVATFVKGMAAGSLLGFLIFHFILTKEPPPVQATARRLPLVMRPQALPLQDVSRLSTTPHPPPLQDISRIAAAPSPSRIALSLPVRERPARSAMAASTAAGTVGGHGAAGTATAAFTLTTGTVAQWTPHPCPASCSGHGTCNLDTGECMCWQGYTGIDCSSDEALQCDLEGEELVPRCMGVCDKSMKCVCGGGKHPLRAMFQVRLGDRQAACAYPDSHAAPTPATDCTHTRNRLQIVTAPTSRAGRAKPSVLTPKGSSRAPPRMPPRMPPRSRPDLAPVLPRHSVSSVPSPRTNPGRARDGTT